VHLSESTSLEFQRSKLHTSQHLMKLSLISNCWRKKLKLIIYKEKTIFLLKNQNKP